MLLPRALKRGNIIGIVAPSNCYSPVNIEEVDNFIDYITNMGLVVQKSKNFSATDKYNVSAGTSQQRADDINSMFADKNINAIWCLQGGSTGNQLLDLIDYQLIKKNPKIFIGKSDIDILSLVIHIKTSLVTFHGPDAKLGGKNLEMDSDYTKEWFKQRLFSGSKLIKPAKSGSWKTIRKGNTVGKLIGCNVTTILKTAGTKYFPDFTESIFFIETFNTKISRFLSQLRHLEMVGVFDKIKGIVVGNNYGFDSLDCQASPEEVVRDITRKYNLPILKINEFGHYQPHCFLPIGCQISLDATDKKLEIIDDFID